MNQNGKGTRFRLAQSNVPSSQASAKSGQDEAQVKMKLSVCNVCTGSGLAPAADDNRLDATAWIYQRRRTLLCSDDFDDPLCHMPVAWRRQSMTAG